MGNSHVSVQTERFSVGEQHEWLAQCDSDGAIVTFTGKVRNHNLGDEVNQLMLEHYPGMTEKVLNNIVLEARGRWPLERISVIHRIGCLSLGEEIVFVGVSSVHRDAAFSAAEFIMDYLKTKAPFWKKEILSDKERWIEAKESDQQSTNRW